MIKEIIRVRYVIFLTIVIFVLFYLINDATFLKQKAVSGLVIYGDNISSTYEPFVENDAIYLSFDTIKDNIDENIFYDKISSKVIVTTYNDVIKFKIGENKISKNLEYSDLSTPAKIVNSEVYIPIETLKDVYGIDVEYNKSTNTIVIDKKTNDIAKIAYNKTKVYSYISTKSEVIDELNKDDEVISYTEALTHNRWLKVKTNSGVVGYINKNAAQISEAANEDETITTSEKINMFWQYSNDIDILGRSKIEGVNVVSPTWYELKNSSGDINSKYSSDYYNQAKANGYKVWALINNGIDSVNYSSSDTSALLNSEYNREQFIKNLLQIIEEDKLDGINIDFETMKEEDKDLYTQLIRELAPLVRNKGKAISVDTYFVKYIDRKRVGAACDYIILMGYDQRGSWSSEAGSISEISWVEENVDSLINDSNIPPEKIILGVPFYTRLWTKNTTTNTIISSKIYSMYQADSYVKTNNLTKIWDEDAGQNYVELTKGDIKYMLWVEDAASIKKRVETINKYNLAGICAWKKGLETDDIWKVISDNLGK